LTGDVTEGALQAGQDPARADAVAVDRLAKRYGTRTAIEDLSFAVRENEFVSVVGPSGCGNSLA
jgi:ABC-type sugar transport system ATPase subunit